MTNHESLPHPIYGWVEKNMPKLHKELCAFPELDMCRIHLNKLTGLQFQPTDVVDESLYAYLDRLMEMQG